MTQSRITKTDLESDIDAWIDRYNDMVQQRNDMLEALRVLVDRAMALDQSVTHDGIENCYALAKAREAIAKATGA